MILIIKHKDKLNTAPGKKFLLNFKKTKRGIIKTINEIHNLAGRMSYIYGIVAIFAKTYSFYEEKAINNCQPLITRWN